MDNKNEAISKRKTVRGSFALSNPGRFPMARIVSRERFNSNCRSEAVNLVDAILGRGNAAQMKNVGSQFVVTELVVA